MIDNCGCRVDIFGRVSLCPMHEAAPAMLAALKGLAKVYNINTHSVVVNQDSHYWEQALKAISQAEGCND